MKLSHAEANQLFRALLASFPNPVRLDMILGQPPMNTALARIVTGGTLEDDYFQLVTAANAEGWIGPLLDGLRGADRINPALIALIDGFGQSRAPTNVPAHLELLLDGAPFVNQHPLRHALLTMTQPHGPKVLHVTGTPTSGRTYSQYLIAHVARSVNARINLPLPFEATTTARDVIQDLADQMKLGMPPTIADGPQDSTAVTRMVRWFAIAANDLKDDWWLIFDGFDSQKIDDSLRMLMYGLAQVIGNGLPSRIRLFLLAWDQPISGPPPGRVFEQGVQPFDRPHVKDYLDELITQFAMPRGMTSTDEILTLCYDGWDSVPDPIARATTLTTRLQRIAQAALDAKAGR
ncbi:effector-associated domain EAD1-containing protein [uncultured Paracoccus sp.]|uniref:effector-associated domain EAD1-containing protein n=1 Tax=uncultured Paracoccus sp. TaxID=189685 RepID=UPI0025FD4460|nr:effector-associated domain EAD1-containing protein [uncultured Paracoccus sp.]